MSKIKDFFKSLFKPKKGQPTSKAAPQEPKKPKPLPTERSPNLDEAEERKTHRPGPPKRDIQLGIDFGTSWSKLAFRDDYSRGGGKSYGVAIRAADGHETIRIPSLIAIEGNHLLFGAAAEERRAKGKGNIVTSLKGRLACPGKYPPYEFAFPEGLSEQDLAALLVLHLHHIGKSRIWDYCRPLKQEPRISMTIGAPIDTMGQSELLDGFLEFAGLAYEMERLGGLELIGGKLPLKLAKDVIREGRKALQPKMEAIRALPQQYILPEVAAALLWHYYSPTVPTGLYASVDVGAGTTDASFFNKLYQSEKHEMLPWPFFGAKSAPPATDHIDMILAKATGEAEWHTCRGRENELTQRLDRSQSQKAISGCMEICKIYQQAFGAAYAKDKRTSQWERYGLILIGGGAQVSLIREHLINHRVLDGLSRPPEIVPAEKPADFVLSPQFDKDHGFLSVAYGLSCCASFPRFARPDEIAPLDHRVDRDQRVRVEDMYD